MVAGNGQWALLVNIKKKNSEDFQKRYPFARFFSQDDKYARFYGKESIYRHHPLVKNNITRLFKFASGVDWLPGDDYNHRKALANAIPPAYTNWLGIQLKRSL